MDSQFITLVERAMSVLTPTRFTVWMFIVGYHGTDEERLSRGRHALRQMIKTQDAAPYRVFSQEAQH